MRDARKKCRACAEVKPINDFPWRKQYQIDSARCYACVNAGNRASRAKKRALRKSLVIASWTSEDDAALLRFILTGKSATEAALKLGRTKGAVQQRRCDKCLPPFARQPRKPARRPRAKKWTDDRLIVVARLLKEGESRGRIGVIVGETRNAVIGAIHRNRERIHALAP